MDLLKKFFNRKLQYTECILSDKTPTGDECLLAIRESLDAYYVLSYRNDVYITQLMKYEALNSFQRERDSVFHLYNGMSNDWFMKTQWRQLSK